MHAYTAAAATRYGGCKITGAAICSINGLGHRTPSSIINITAGWSTDHMQSLFLRHVKTRPDLSETRFCYNASFKRDQLQRILRQQEEFIVQMGDSEVKIFHNLISVF